MSSENKKKIVEVFKKPQIPKIPVVVVPKQKIPVVVIKKQTQFIKNIHNLA